MRHTGLTDEEKEGHAYFLNTLSRDISKKEKQEAAIRLRKEGKSYRLIASWLGVGHATVIRWTKSPSECSGVPNEPPEQTADTADGKVYPAKATTQPVITERAGRIQTARDSGLTIREIAQQEGVSVGTVHADLKRDVTTEVDDGEDYEDLADEPDEKPAIDIGGKR